MQFSFSPTCFHLPFSWQHKNQQIFHILLEISAYISKVWSWISKQLKVLITFFFISRNEPNLESSQQYLPDEFGYWALLTFFWNMNKLLKAFLVLFITVLHPKEVQIIFQSLIKLSSIFFLAKIYFIIMFLKYWGNF